MGQTENPKTAPQLKNSLMDLSKRMEEDKTLHNFAFEVTTIAMGIFTDPKDPPKPEWTELPPEVLRVIFSQNDPLKSRPRELEKPSDVSKEWKKNAEIVETDSLDQWVNSLRKIRAFL